MMEFVNISEIIDEVVAEVPGCPVYTVRKQVIWAAIEFCRETNVSVYTEYEIDIDADCEVIQLPCPSASVRVWQPLWIKTARAGNSTLHPLNRRRLAERGANWQGLEGDWPLSYVRLNKDRIQLIPMPKNDHEAALTIHCSYLPAREATRLDEVLIEEYGDAIINGALYRLLRMSKQAWHDAVESRERRDWFSMAMSDAKALAIKDFQSGEQTVIMRPMA